MRRGSCAVAVVALSVVALGLVPAPARAQGPALPPRDRPLPPIGKGTVRGSVVDAATGQVLRRAVVSLSVTQPGPGTNYRLSTTTDGNGQFEFRGVASGTLTISAARSGYLRPEELQDGGRRRPDSLALRDGQTIEGVKVGLHRGGAIVGRITDEFGDPAPGVEIELRRRNPYGPGFGFAGASMGRGAITDDTGAFRAWGLAPGTYLISARPNRYMFGPEARDDASRQGHAPTFYPGTPAAADAKPIVVTAGRDTDGVAFALVPAMLATVRGTVLVPSGVPARQVNVMVSQVTSDDLGTSGSGANLNDDGSFEVRRLAPGTYRLTAQVWDSLGQRARWRATADVTVSGEDIDGVSLAMRGGSTLSGRIVTDDGSPFTSIGRVMVNLMPMAPGPSTPFVRPVQANADGTFRIEGVFGRHRVGTGLGSPTPPPPSGDGQVVSVFPAPGSTPAWQLKAVMVDGRDMTDTPLDLEQSVGDVEIVMTSRVSRVSGAVTSSQPPGTVRQLVVVFVDDPEKWERPTRHVRPTVVGDDGHFQVSGLPPGERYLAVAVDDIAMQDLIAPETLAALRNQATPLRIDEGGAHEINLRAVPNPRP